MRRYIAENLVFLNKFIFNEKIDWCYRVYGPIGNKIRYLTNINRDYIYSIYVIMTVNN